MKRIFAIAILGLLGAAPAGQSGYMNDFEKIEAGKAPEDAMILNGAFAVKKEQGNQYLELAATPLESFGILVGPDGQALRTMTARIRGEATGRRTPEFGIGVGGVGGYLLWVMPAVDELQIKSGDDVVARIPFAWKSGAWTMLRLNIAPDGVKFIVQGKAWPAGQAEPEKWMIATPAEKLPVGRATLWGTPYSEKPVGFDDVVIGP